MRISISFVVLLTFAGQVFGLAPMTITHQQKAGEYYSAPTEEEVVSGIQALSEFLSGLPRKIRQKLILPPGMEVPNYLFLLFTGLSAHSSFVSSLSIPIMRSKSAAMGEGMQMYVLDMNRMLTKHEVSTVISFFSRHKDFHVVVDPETGDIDVYNLKAAQRIASHYVNYLSVIPGFSPHADLLTLIDNSNKWSTAADSFRNDFLKGLMSGFPLKSVFAFSFPGHENNISRITRKPQFIEFNPVSNEDVDEIIHAEKKVVQTIERLNSQKQLNRLEFDGKLVYKEGQRQGFIEILVDKLHAIIPFSWSS